MRRVLTALLLSLTLTASAVEPSLAPGAPIDRSSFRVVRPIPKVPAGLVILILDPDVLGNSCDLADVRIVTADNRQVPYLVEKRDTPLEWTVYLTPIDAPPGTSVYRASWPWAALPCDSRLVLRTYTRVFERTVELRSAAEPQRGRSPQVLASQVWRATDPEKVPPTITFDVANADGRNGLEVVVNDGDNARLRVADAKLLIPSTVLRFHHPGSELFLLYGNDPLMPPRYDLTLLAQWIRGQPARELQLQPIVPMLEEEGPQTARKYFWIAIGLVAVVLLVLLVKLLGPKAPSASD